MEGSCQRALYPQVGGLILWCTDCISKIENRVREIEIGDGYVQQGIVRARAPLVDG